MTDRKDPPPKGPDTGAKRPYTTLDLKATEVRTPSSGSPQPAGETKTSAATGTPASAAAKDDQSAAAARVAAAAAAVTTPRPTVRAEPRTESGSSGPGSASPSNWSAYGSHAAAGVAGGLLALIGSFLIGPSQDTRPASTDLVQSLNTRIAALEQQAKQGQSLPADTARRLAGLESSVAQITDLNRAVTALREQHAKLAEQAEALRSAAARSPDRETAARIDKLQEQLAALAAMAAADPQNAGRIPQLAQILGKLNDLEGALTTRLAGLRKDLTQDIDTKTAAVVEASEAAKSGVQRLDRDVTEGRSEATRSGQRIDTLKAGTDRLDQGLRSLQTETAALKTAIDAVEGQLRSTTSAVAPLSTKVAGIEDSLQNVVRADGDRKTAAERIVLSLELGNLKRALDRGGSYAAELDAVRKRGGTNFDLNALERYQHDGVPLEAELAREFQTVANAIIDADTEKPDASLMDRLLSGARTIVRVRKVTHAPGDTSTEAVVGRMEIALKENRLGDVLAEAGKLSARAAIPAQDWLKKVEARQAVQTSLAAVDAALKASLVNAPAAGQKGQR